MEIKASYVMDKKHIRDLLYRLSGGKLRGICVLGTASVLLSPLWFFWGHRALALAMALWGLFALTLPSLLCAFALSAARKKGTDGEREVYLSGEGLLLKNLRQGTESFYPLQQIQAIMERRGAYGILLPEKRCLLLRPEDFSGEGFQDFCRFAAELDRLEDIYERKSIACTSYVLEKQAAGMAIVNGVLRFLCLLGLFFLGAVALCMREYFLVFAVFFSLPLGLIILLNRRKQRRLLNGRPHIRHDLCFAQYRSVICPQRDKRLLMMALCRLAAGHKRRAKQALDRIDPEKLREAYRELYENALALPGEEEGEALLEQLLRLERRRGLLLELAIGALLIALCVQVFLMLI